MTSSPRRLQQLRAYGTRRASRGPARHWRDRRSTHKPGWRRRPAGTRRCPSPSVPVRETADGAYRPFL